MRKFLLKMKCLNCEAEKLIEVTEKEYHQAIVDNDVDHTPDCPGEKVYVSSKELAVAK